MELALRSWMEVATTQFKDGLEGYRLDCDGAPVFGFVWVWVRFLASIPAGVAWLGPSHRPFPTSRSWHICHSNIMNWVRVFRPPELPLNNWSPNCTIVITVIVTLAVVVRGNDTDCACSLPQEESHASTKAALLNQFRTKNNDCVWWWSHTQSYPLVQVVRSCL